MARMCSPRSLSILMVLLAGLLVSPARGEEKPNPEYAAWAKFKPGTTAVYAMEMDAGAMKASLELTSKLVEVKADKVIVEQTTTTIVNGQSRTRPAKQRDIPAKKEFSETKPLGEEDVEVAGKKIHCKVVEGVAETPGAKPGEAKAKLYTSDSVPGGIVKMTGTTPQGTMTTVLKSFEIK